MSAIVKRPSQVPQFSIEIQVASGAGVGRVFSFSKPRVTIGREVDNDVIVEDIKVSRHHCEVELTEQGLRVVNVSERNSIFVGGQAVQEAHLHPQSEITVGDTTLAIRYQFFNPQVLQQLIQQNKKSKSSISLPFVSGMDWKRLRFYGIVVLGALLAYLFFSEEAKQGNTTSVRTEYDLSKSIDQSLQKIKELEQKRAESGRDSLQFQMAEQHYVKGFRDYRQGQFRRAMDSFGAALAVFPSHELAKKYYGLSHRKFYEEVQQHMNLGKKYRGKNNFRLCRSSFMQVMVMLKDASNPTFKEAKQLFDECSYRLEEGI